MEVVDEVNYTSPPTVGKEERKPYVSPYTSESSSAEGSTNAKGWPTWLPYVVGLATMITFPWCVRHCPMCRVCRNLFSCGDEWISWVLKTGFAVVMWCQQQVPQVDQDAEMAVDMASGK